MLDGFVDFGTPTAKFLVSYLPAHEANEDCQGKEWVGTSHQSSTAGVVKHSLSWIKKECSKRNLLLDELEYPAFDGQFWLLISRTEQAKKPRGFWK